MFVSRRSLIMGMGAALAAPKLVSASSLMPIRGIIMPVPSFRPMTWEERIGALWRLDGRVPVRCADVFEWGKFFERKDRFIAKTIVGDCHVSTVFIGMDHSFLPRPDDAPVLFESMTFGPRNSIDRKIDEMDQRRYTSYDDAERGHREMVAELKRKQMKIIKP